VQWLKEVFLKYWIDWEKSSKDESEGFSKTEKGNMLLSDSTWLGLKMTCKLIYLFIIYEWNAIYVHR